MTRTSHCLPLGDLMIGICALHSSMPHSSWTLTAGLTRKVLIVNGWPAKCLPFGKSVLILLRILVPFAIIRLIFVIIVLATPLLIMRLPTFPLMKSILLIPFEITGSRHSVSDVGSLGTGLTPARPRARVKLLGLSSLNGRTTNWSLSSPTNQYVSCSMYEGPAAITTNLNMVNILAPSVPIPNTVLPRARETDFHRILYKVITPYVPEAWRQALLDVDLTQNYPNLVHDLEFGSPIGNPPLIDFTFTPKNLPSAEIMPDYITNLISGEVSAGHMDGPFSVEEAHLIYGGHFRTCPLGLVEKPGSVDLRMIRHFSKEDQFGRSTNSWLDSDDFPTHWFTVAETADFVSTSFTLFAPSTPSLHHARS